MALGSVGAAQTGIAVTQALGYRVGLPPDHAMGGHLRHESSSWSIALGVVMVGAACWPRAASGLAAVLTAFVAVLAGYVVADALAGAVTVARILTHVPVVMGAVFAALVWRDSPDFRPRRRAPEPEPELGLPHNASRGRRRGHLWSADGAA